MGAKIIWFVVAVLIVVACFMGYQHYKQTQTQESGDVTCKGCMSPEDKARFNREDHGETADGQSDHKNETARQSAADIAATPTQMPQQQGSNAYPAGQQPAGNQQPGNQQPGAIVYPSPTAGGYGTASTPVGMAAPMTDTATANAPNGMRFAGSGTYQWYRQGNLTWRINTASGQSCIVYATMDEWRKQIVMSHGCGRDA